MRAPLDSSPQARSTASYLADREGLQGTARLVFLALLHDVFGFRSTPPRPTASWLAALAVVLACGGIGVELRVGAGAGATWLWLIVVAVGAGLAGIVARESHRSTKLDPEADWRAYCVLVRPLILRRRPGLLDQNLTAACGAAEKIVPAPGRALSAVLRERSVDFWVPAAIGWETGAAAALVCRSLSNHSPWLLALPLGGMVLGPVVWSGFRLLVFRRLERIARD